jgi:serine/threonine-protein kinase
LLDGRYRLGPSLGRGTTGEVFRATDLQTGTDVAVKMFTRLQAKQSQVDGPATGREALAAARLRHPGIAAVLDADPSGDEAWLVSELAPGVPLTRYVQAQRLLPEPLVFLLAARMAEALAHAHAQGVVHRDIKPANVLVDLPSATLKLIDFGVAHVDDGTQTRTGMTLGTPSYMAPEQLVGLPVSPASDAYAMGVVLFEMLTARRPHGGASLGELLRQVAEAPAADLASLRPDLPRPAAAAVQQLLSRDPQQRPADLAAWGLRAEQLAASLRAGGAT